MHTTDQLSRKSLNYLTFGLDREAPITVSVPIVQVDEQAQNQAILGVAETLGRRTQIRVSTEVWCKWRGRWRYKRMRARHVTVSCPSPEQAGLVTEAIVAFVKSLEGKCLVPSPDVSSERLEVPEVR
jgi:hypothetical protein